MTKSLFINKEMNYLKLSIKTQDPDYKNIFLEIKEMFPNCTISGLKNKKLGNLKIKDIELFICPLPESFDLISSIGEAILKEKYDIKIKDF